DYYDTLNLTVAQHPSETVERMMAGHLGDVKCTTQNLEVVRIDEARQLLLIKGAVPGSRGGDVMVQPAVKSAEASK
ncbi:MAG: YaeQ family protein, partial [Gammaproteobacteria bacterium]|nr:YaeQ family protein [Gammaproteobacteria bacterium]